MGYVYAGQYGPEALISAAGLPQAALTVTVYKADGVTLATLYTDRTKTTTAANPVSTDTNGNLTFFADPGRYVAKAVMGGINRTYDLVLYPDPETLGQRINVLDFGATGNGTTDDTAAINAAINALPATAGVLYLPAGNYLVTGGLTLAKAGTVVLGDGCGDATDGTAGLTRITCASGTATIFTATAHNVTFRSLDLYCSASGATAAKGIAATANGNGNRYLDVTLYGFNIGIDVQDGAEWWADRCYFQAITGYGFKIANAALPDGGDMSIANCQFKPQGSALAAIRQESGGGLRLVNCKINGNPGSFAYGLDVAPTATTGVLLVGNNSFENVGVNAIRIATTSTISFGRITVHGNEFGLYNDSAGSPILLTGAFAGSIYDVAVTGNTFLANVTTTHNCVSATYAKNIRLSGNVNNGFPDLLDQTSCTNVFVAAEGYGRDRLVAAGGETLVTVDAGLLANSLLLWKQTGGTGNPAMLVQGTDYTVSANVASLTAALSGSDVLATYYATATASPAASRLSSSYTATVLADSPAAYWTGADLTDGLGGSNTLTLQGTGASAGNASIRPSGGGKSFAFGGSATTGWIKSATALAALSGASAFTFEAWVKATAFNGASAYASDILGWYDGTTYYEMLRFGDGSNSANVAKVNTALSTSTVQNDVMTSFTGSTGTVYHVVVTWTSGTTPILYINGTAQTTPTNNIGGTLRTQSTPFGIGAAAMPSINRIFNGNIQDVAIYPTALSAARVTAHYNAG